MFFAVVIIDTCQSPYTIDESGNIGDSPSAGGGMKLQAYILIGIDFVIWVLLHFAFPLSKRKFMPLFFEFEPVIYSRGRILYMVNHLLGPG
jgi:hypothetical protein